MGGARWVIPGSRLQATDRAAKLQSGSPPGLRHHPRLRMAEWICSFLRSLRSLAAIPLPASARLFRRRYPNKVSLAPSPMEPAEQKCPEETALGIGAAMTKMRLRRFRARLTSSLVIDSQVCPIGFALPSFLNAVDAQIPETRPV